MRLTIKRVGVSSTQIKGVQPSLDTQAERVTISDGLYHAMAGFQGVGSSAMHSVADI